MIRVLRPGYVSFRQMRTFVSPFPPVGSVAAPFESPAVPHLPRNYGVIRLLGHPSVPPDQYSGPEEAGSSLGFLGNPFGSMLRARDSGDPGPTSQ